MQTPVIYRQKRKGDLFMDDIYLKITVNGLPYAVKIEEMVYGKNTVKKDIPPKKEVIYSEKKPVPVKASDTIIKACVQGILISIMKREGDNVREGDLLLTIKTMKERKEIAVPVDGRIKMITGSIGDKIIWHQVLAIIGTEEEEYL